MPVNSSQAGSDKIKHYIKKRVVGGLPYELARIQVEAIRRDELGRYWAKIHPESTRQPACGTDDDGWFKFNKSTYGTVVNDYPSIACGEMLTL
jgi:hypothetical protein